MANLISLQSDSNTKAQAMLAALSSMNMLDLWFVGLLPAHVQAAGWVWDAPVAYGDGWESDYLQCLEIYEYAPKMALVLGSNLAGLKEVQVIAKLNFLLMLKEEKGSVLPTSWIDALSSDLPLFWSANQSVTPPWLLRIAKAFGQDVLVAPQGKPDPNGIWLGDKTPNLGEGQHWKGPILSSQEGMEHYWLQEADFGGYLSAIATEVKEENTLLLYDTLWVQWKNEGVYLPGIRRENRNFYTLRIGTIHHWVDCPHALWGNQLVRWAVNGASSSAISKAVNRDATELVAPSRLYGDPSPLNKSQDRNTVGHLEMNLPSWGPHYMGTGSMLPDMLSDCDAFAPIRAAEFAYEAGLPVLYQHQLETVRVGEIAAACGKSVINITVELESGELRTVQMAIGQFLVDKATKLFNRDSLLGRCPAVVHIFRKGDGNSEAKASLSSLKAKAKGLLKG